MSVLLGDLRVDTLDLILQDTEQTNEVALRGLTRDLPAVGSMTDREVGLHLVDDAASLGECILAEVALDSFVRHSRTLSGVTR